MGWTRKNTTDRVRQAAKDVGTVDLVPLTPDIELTTIPLTKAYWVNGVHTYIDLPNALALLGGADQVEDERCHRRLLRFLHLYQRVANLVFEQTDAVKVDFQNERLHLIVYQPYDSARLRIATSVAIADLVLQVIAAANRLHEELRDARICIGSESGMALAVNNGTRGDREPLFLGNPANIAAKLLMSPTPGIYLGPEARAEFGWTIDNPTETPLTPVQVSACRTIARLTVTAGDLLSLWEKELHTTPLAEFTFQRPTPPLKDLDLDVLTPPNSRRVDAAVITADVDGFTRFIAEMNARGEAKTAIRVLHVVRKELRDVLNDFGGRKIRYVGDCVGGVMAEGERQTDAATTVTGAVLCAAAMRDAFAVIQQELPEARTLGIAIGVDFGPVSITRLGRKGSRDRCMVGRAVLASRAAQESCNGLETALGAAARSVATPAVRALFPDAKPRRDVTFNVVAAVLEAREDPAMARYVSAPGAPAVVIPRAHASRGPWTR